MADAEVNALVTRGESSMAVIIDDVMEDEIEIHEATETNHEATVQTEGELRSVNQAHSSLRILAIEEGRLTVLSSSSL